MYAQSKWKHVVALKVAKTCGSCGYLLLHCNCIYVYKQAQKEKQVVNKLRKPHPQPSETNADLGKAQMCDNTLSITVTNYNESQVIVNQKCQA